MGQRDSRHHHANRRRRTESASGGASQEQGHAQEPRVPLAGYESLYEISRSGRVYPRDARVVLPGAYHHSPFIRITAHGRVVTLPKARAIAQSFGDAQAERRAAAD